MQERFNIDEIGILYPKAFTYLSEYLSIRGLNKNDVDFLLLLRFFDENQLYIGISADVDGEHWYVEVSEMQIDCVSTRGIAEILAIAECFEIMEKILNNE